MHPLISIIVVSWNSKEYLPRGLSGLETQTYRDFEVILIDNGSTDESTARVLEKYPNISFNIERFESNQGFALQTTWALAWRVENSWP
jgi:glycosyltransferase involved in cell wall biosynthesis